ncbi:regulatory protein RecX [candidate division KSB1 bacterium]
MPTESHLIDAMEKIKRRGGWYRCSFEKGGPLDIDQDMLIRHELHVGKTLSGKMYDTLKRESETAHARESALRLLSYRARSRKELIKRLRGKGFQMSIVDSVMNGLKEKGLVDDEEFAKLFVSDLIRRRPAGTFLIKSELQKKGIEGPVIERIIEDTFRKHDPVELAGECARQWLKRHAKTPEPERRKKLSHYLYQRGFSWTIIEDVLGDSSAF